MLIHIMLVSGQTIPNLVPALMERPAKTYLVATEGMQRNGLAQRLGRILDTKGIAWAMIDGAPDAGYTSILAYAGSVAARIEREHPSAAIVLNATGGTKLMALGFVEILRARRARVILWQRWSLTAAILKYAPTERRSRCTRTANGAGPCR